ncbi:MAG: nitrophenyl compound nitroreductase subunit ArsF family protein [Alphaproteobacteria bacterium]|nr:nitrophenyl compound nitroreductase subunit ArsF family protein [Alphaproteobacteria bacterium]
MLKKILIVAVAFFGLMGAAKAETDKIMVYYFHSNVRCVTCNKMEAFTKEAVEANFKDNKNIVFKAVNTDEPANKHFLKDYSLYTKSVVLADEQGNWKNLDKIWSLVRNEADFKAYIVDGINDFTKAKK